MHIDRSKSIASTLLAVGLLVTAETSVLAQTALSREILTGTHLFAGFDMGVDSSEHRTDWLSSDPSGAIRMAYPAGQSWGAVFVTVGVPKSPPRPSMDLSSYTTLLIEVRGDSGSTIEIGVKD